MTRLSRRNFGAILAASGAAIPTFAQQPVQQPPQQPPRGPRPEVLPFDGPIEFTRQDVALKIEPFPMHQVTVTGGMFKDAEDWNRGYMTRLAPDRLLYNFRENAGLAIGSAKPLADMSADRVSSWEHPNDGKRGFRTARPLHGTLSFRQRTTGGQWRQASQGHRRLHGG